MIAEDRQGRVKRVAKDLQAHLSCCSSLVHHRCFRPSADETWFQGDYSVAMRRAQRSIFPLVL